MLSYYFHDPKPPKAKRQKICTSKIETIMWFEVNAGYVRTSFTYLNCKHAWPYLIYVGWSIKVLIRTWYILRQYNSVQLAHEVFLEGNSLNLSLLRYKQVAQGRDFLKCWYQHFSLCWGVWSNKKNSIFYLALFIKWNYIFKLIWNINMKVERSALMLQLL